MSQAHIRDRSERLLELRPDGEITREEFGEKKAELEQESARVTRRLGQAEALVAQGEDDLEQPLALANQLPTLWGSGG